MKKDDLIKGIEAVDDELIEEAASVPSAISYKTKLRIRHAVMISAAVVGMAAVVLFMHSKNAPLPENSENDTVTAELYTEPTSQNENKAAFLPDGDKEKSGENSQSAPTETNTETAPETATKAVSTEKKLSETTTAPADREVVIQTTPAHEPEKTLPAVIQAETKPAETPTITVTETQPATETPAVTQTEPIEPVTIFEPVQDYSYAGDAEIIGVQYGASIIALRDNTWLNCSKEQSDRWLDYVSKFDLSVTYAEVYFAGGGYMLRILYNDGTHMDYEFFKGYYVIVTNRDGSHVTYGDVSGYADILHDEIYDTYLANIDIINRTIEENRTW